MAAFAARNVNPVELRGPRMDTAPTQAASCNSELRSTMPGHLADHLATGRHVPGIFLISKALDVAILTVSLPLIVGASLPNEYQDQIVYPPLLTP